MLRTMNVNNLQELKGTRHHIVVVASFLVLLAISTFASIRTAAAEGSGFINEIVVDGLYQPSNIEFLPNGSMLIAQLDGIIRILPLGQSQVDPSPFLNQDWVSDPLDLALDPDFEENHYYYLFYNRLDIDRDRVSRFTVNAAMTGTVPGSELVLWQDDSGHCCHHNGGSIAIDAGRSIFITVGD